MNQKAKYEITITDKLQQLQLPDMRDAIWSRIEQQLDLDMPEDDPNDPNGPNSPSDTGWWKHIGKNFGPFAFIVAVVTIFFISKNDNKTTDNNRKTPRIENTITQPQVNDPESPPGNIIPNQSKQDAPQATPGNTPTPGSDSVFYEPTRTEPLIADTTPTVNSPPVVQAQIPAKQDTVARKPRGVKGITDSDYKISLKKDSTP